MRKIFKSLFIFTVVLIFLPLLVHAQLAADPGCDPLDPYCPVDGGLVLLIATGAFYGIYKLRNKKHTLTPPQV